MSLGPADFNFGSATPITTTPGLTMGNYLTSVPGMDTTGFGAPTGVAGSSMFDKANLALSGLQTIAGIWNAFQAQKMARRQFAFTKDVTNTNLANQIQSYNTALADRARSRGVMEGQTPGQVSGYISANGLSRDSGKNGPSSIGNITAAALSNYGSYVNRDPSLGH